MKFFWKHDKLEVDIQKNVNLSDEAAVLPGFTFCILSPVTDEFGFMATGFIEPVVILSRRQQSSFKIA